MDINEAKELLVIDKNSLDEECIKHSNIFLEVGRECAEAISLRDEAKEKKEEVWAKEFIKIKQGGKISDQQAKSMADSSDEYQNSLRDFLNKKRKADDWTIIKESWQYRAAMLKYLCELYISGFYGVIAISKEDKYEKMKERLNKEREKGVLYE